MSLAITIQNKILAIRRSIEELGFGMPGGVVITARTPPLSGLVFIFLDENGSETFSPRPIPPQVHKGYQCQNCDAGFRPGF